MVNLTNQEFVKQFAQHARLTSSQIQAASQWLSNKDVSIAFCQQYAMGDAFGLSFSQWAKVKQFIRDQQVLQSLPENNAAHVLQVRRFLPFDIALKQHISLPSRLKSYPKEQLLAFVDQLISQPNTNPLDLLKQTFESADESLLLDLRAVVLLKLIETPDLLQMLRQSYYLHAQAELEPQSSKLSEHHKALLSDWPKPGPVLKKLDAHLLLRFWNLKNGGHLNLKWVYPHGEKEVLAQLANSLGWQEKGQLADAWISDAIHWVWQQCLSKVLFRDMLGMAYDVMVEQLLPAIELKWRQLFSVSSLGSKPVLVIYPHGRSGVMLLAVDADGQVKDEAMVFPFAPDYDGEHTLVDLAKLLIKYNIEDVALVVRTETRKLLLKTIKNLKKRYTDLKLAVHFISGEYSPVLMDQQIKHPEPEHVAKFAQFLQCPMAFFATIPAKKWLPVSLQSLPNSLIDDLWKDLLQTYLYTEGLDVNQASKESLLCLGLSAEVIEKLISHRPFASRQQVMEALSLPEERFSALVGMIRVENNENPLDATPVLPEDVDYIQSLAKEQGLKIEDLIANPSLIPANHERACRIKSLLRLHTNKLQVLKEDDLTLLNHIEVGSCFQGVVTKVMSYGVFVDLGEGVEGLMHISTMGDQFICDLNLLFQAGDVITVEWAHYDAEQKRLSLKFPKLKVAAPSTQVNKPAVKKPIQQQQKPKQQKLEQKTKSQVAQAPNAMQLAFAKLKK